MKLYLDMCVLKRPFDDQSQERIVAETRAITLIIDRIEKGSDSLVWSPALDFENDADPDGEARTEVARYSTIAEFCFLTRDIEERIEDLSLRGVGRLDAAHLAFAEAAANVLITCDDSLLRRATRIGCLIRLLNPIEYLREIGHGQ